MDVCIEKLSGLEKKLECSFKLAVAMVEGRVQELTYYLDGRMSISEKESSGIL